MEGEGVVGSIKNRDENKDSMNDKAEGRKPFVSDTDLKVDAYTRMEVKDDASSMRPKSRRRSNKLENLIRFRLFESDEENVPEKNKELRKR